MQSKNKFSNEIDEQEEASEDLIEGGQKNAIQDQKTEVVVTSTKSKAKKPTKALLDSDSETNDEKSAEKASLTKHSDSEDDILHVGRPKRSVLSPEEQKKQQKKDKKEKKKKEKEQQKSQKGKRTKSPKMWTLI